MASVQHRNTYWSNLLQMSEWLFNELWKLMEHFQRHISVQWNTVRTASGSFWSPLSSPSSSLAAISLHVLRCDLLQFGMIWFCQDKHCSVFVEDFNYHYHICLLRLNSLLTDTISSPNACRGPVLQVLQHAPLKGKSCHSEEKPLHILPFKQRKWFPAFHGCIVIIFS